MTVPPGLWLPSQQKGLAGFMLSKVRKHELSLSSLTRPANKRLQYSLPPFTSGTKSTIETQNKSKLPVKPSFACAPPAHNRHQQSKGTFLVWWEFRHTILINVNASRVAKSLYATSRVYSKIEI